MSRQDRLVRPRHAATRGPQAADQLVWERPEPVLPAGRPAAGAEEIAAAAFAIADREGLRAVSVRRVAARLKVGAPALAAFLPTTDDLLDLMMDRALGEIETPEDPTSHWRDQLSRLAYATKAVLERHPWLRSLAGTRTPSGPNGLRVSEFSLAALGGYGLRPVEALPLVNAVIAYVYGYTQLETGYRPRHGDGTLADADTPHRARTARHLQDLAASGAYPQLAGVFAEADRLSTDQAFEMGLRAVLDGVESMLGELVSRAVPALV